MSIEVKVPSLPESIADAVVLSWHKNVGDFVKRDESLVEIETDKVVLDVPAPQDGIVTTILEQEGAVVISEQILATLKAADKNEAAHNVVEKSSSHENENENNDGIIITPSAKKLMADKNIDSSHVSGSGRGGRILKEDVLRYLNAQSSMSSQDIPQESPTQISPQTNNTQADERFEKRVPMTRLRARIAERLLDAQHNAAILTTINEVNMQAVMDLRKKYKDQFEKKYKVKLGFMSFFIKAVIEALKEHPSVNASIDGNDIVYHGYFDIGVAVSSPRGLVVPVIRDTQNLDMAQIEEAIVGFGAKAKNNSLTIEELTGGTFTVSNGGVFGSLLSTPILNPPQSGILGMHKIQMRPIVEDDTIVARPMMYLALSYDHRIIDGREAVQFLVTLKNALEDPSRMLMSV